MRLLTREALTPENFATGYRCKRQTGSALLRFMRPGIGANGHLHGHLLLISLRPGFVLDQELVAREWAKATGGRLCEKAIAVRPLTTEQDFRKVCSYLLKDEGLLAKPAATAPAEQPAHRAELASEQPDQALWPVPGQDSGGLGPDSSWPAWGAGGSFAQAPPASQDAAWSPPVAGVVSPAKPLAGAEAGPLKEGALAGEAWGSEWENKHYIKFDGRPWKPRRTKYWFTPSSREMAAIQYPQEVETIHLSRESLEQLRMRFFPRIWACRKLQTLRGWFDEPHGVTADQVLSAAMALARQDVRLVEAMMLITEPGNEAGAAPGSVWESADWLTVAQTPSIPQVALTPELSAKTQEAMVAEAQMPEVGGYPAAHDEARSLNDVTIHLETAAGRARAAGGGRREDPDLQFWLTDDVRTAMYAGPWVARLARQPRGPFRDLPVAPAPGCALAWRARRFAQERRLVTGFWPKQTQLNRKAFRIKCE